MLLKKLRYSAVLLLSVFLFNGCSRPISKQHIDFQAQYILYWNQQGKLDPWDVWWKKQSYQRQLHIRNEENQIIIHNGCSNQMKTIIAYYNEKLENTIDYIYRILSDDSRENYFTIQSCNDEKSVPRMIFKIKVNGQFVNMLLDDGWKIDTSKSMGFY